jgi:peptide/nickel transport system permease protein
MESIKYIIKRILQMIPVMFIVSVLIFVMIRLIPGDPARLVLGEKATNAAVEAMREKLGLNESYFVQYYKFMKGIVTLDLGTSLKYQRPVYELLSLRINVTIMLTVISTLFSLLISFPLGYYAGKYKDKLIDQIFRIGALAAVSMPSFWVGLLLLILFGVKLRWLPVGGWGDTLLEQLKALILPGLTMSLLTSALLIRNIRNSVVDISNMDYVDFAVSKGISERAVKNRHILRNALISTVTLLLMRMAYMLGGSVIIETVFSLPGIGKLMVDSIFGRDYAVVQALVFIFAFLILAINLITDIIYSFLDPRVKF